MWMKLNVQKCRCVNHRKQLINRRATINYFGKTATKASSLNESVLSFVYTAKTKNACRILVATTKEKRSFVKRRCKWNDNAKLLLNKQDIWLQTDWFYRGKDNRRSSGGLL